MGERGGGERGREGRGRERERGERERGEEREKIWRIWIGEQGNFLNVYSSNCLIHLVGQQDNRDRFIIRQEHLLVYICFPQAYCIKRVLVTSNIMKAAIASL